jgi:hypothetical protein
MQGDFTRTTFRPEKHYSSVRMQQGRLQLDADWNEQVDIQNHLTQTQTKNIIGAAGVPLQGGNFRIDVTEDGKDLIIAPGNIYIDGILCELETGTLIEFTGESGQIKVPILHVDGQDWAAGQWVELITNEQSTSGSQFAQITYVDATPRQSKYTLTLSKEINTSGQLRRVITYINQPDYPQPPDLLPDVKYIVYLDVWQRHITAIEDPEIRELALNIPDTTTRTKTVWQVKIIPESEWENFIKNHNRPAYLTARVNASQVNSSSNNGSYRRLENHLYRVEIHSPGEPGKATFKWSRDNASIVGMIDDIPGFSGNSIILNNSIPEITQYFAPNQWVEIIDEVRELTGKPGVLVRLMSESSGNRLVFSKATDNEPIDRNSFPKSQKPKLRRWDYQTTTAEIPTSSEWVPLENGIEVKFEKNSSYHTGDYWLIPSRVISNDIEWLRDSSSQPLPQAKYGIFHHYCKLASIEVNNQQITVTDIRQKFPHLVNSIYKNDDGRVGIGTDNPQAILHVNGAISQNPPQILRISAGDKYLDLGLHPDNKLHLQSNGEGFAFNRGISIDVEQNSTALQITAGEKYVDIGIQPDNKLHLKTNGDGYVLDNKITINAGKISNTVQIKADDKYVDLGIQPDNRLHLQTNGDGYVFDKGISIDAGQISNAVQIKAGDKFVDLGLQPDNRLHLQTNGDGYVFDKGISIDAGQISNAVQIKAGDKFVDLGLQPDNQLHLQTNSDGYVFDKGITIESGQNSNAVQIKTGDKSLELSLNQNNEVQLHTNSNRFVFNKSLTIDAGQNNQSVQIKAGEKYVDLGLQSDNKLHLQTNGDGYVFDKAITINSGIISSAVNGDLLLQTTSGNVGIGVNQTLAKLDIQGTAASNFTGSFAGDSQSDRILILVDKSNYKFQVGDAISVARQTRIITDVVVVKSADNSEQQTLTVNSGFHDLVGDSQVFTLHKPILRLADSNQTTKLIVNSQGYLGINTFHPEAALEVQGNVKFLGHVSPNSQDNGLLEPTLYVQGNVKISGDLLNDGRALISSSRQLKEDILELSHQEVRDILKGLKPVKFIRTSDTDKQHRVGFISEESPDIITSGDKQAISISEITAILTQTVKEHQETIDTFNAFLVAQKNDQQNTLTTLTQTVQQHQESIDAFNAFLAAQKTPQQDTLISFRTIVEEQKKEQHNTLSNFNLVLEDRQKEHQITIASLHKIIEEQQKEVTKLAEKIRKLEGRKFGNIGNKFQRIFSRILLVIAREMRR